MDSVGKQRRVKKEDEGMFLHWIGAGNSAPSGPTFLYLRETLKFLGRERR